MSMILTLAVDIIDASEHFYRNIIQLPVERFVAATNSSPALIIAQGDSTVILRPATTLQAQHPAAFQHFDRHCRGVGISIDFQVDDLNLCLRCLNNNNIDIIYELEDKEHGIRELWFYDPDNYLIILTQIDT